MRCSGGGDGGGGSFCVQVNTSLGRRPQADSALDWRLDLTWRRRFARNDRPRDSAESLAKVSMRSLLAANGAMSVQRTSPPFNARTTSCGRSKSNRRTHCRPLLFLTRPFGAVSGSTHLSSCAVWLSGRSAESSLRQWTRSCRLACAQISSSKLTRALKSTAQIG